LAKKFKVKAFNNLEKMLKQTKPDVVLVLTISGQHFLNCKKILNLGFNIICEKPLAMTSDQCLKLDKIAKLKKKLLGVMFQNRLNPSIQILKKYLKDKKFGKIITISIKLIWCRYQKYYNDGWHGTWLNDGGVTNQQAIHHIDVLNWLLGPLTSITSMISNRVNKLEAEDTMVSIFQTNKGGLGTIEVTTAARPKDYEASITITGTKGNVKIGGIALNKIENWEFANETKKKSQLIKKKYSQVVPNGYGLSHIDYLNDSVNILQNRKKKFPVTPIDAAQTQKLIHAIYLSSEKNKKIFINSKVLKSKYLGQK
jgi:UDP-N-acetyl-2-amino-2-deoxyglucuronate dehydrogenase